MFFLFFCADSFSQLFTVLAAALRLLNTEKSLSALLFWMTFYGAAALIYREFSSLFSVLDDFLLRCGSHIQRVRQCIQKIDEKPA